MRNALARYLSVALVAGTLLAPAVAFANGRSQGRGTSHGHPNGGFQRRGDSSRLHTTLPQRLPPPRHFHGHFHGQRPGFGFVAPGIIYSAPVYAAPAYDPTPVYVPPPPVYVPPVAVPPPPAFAPAPMQTVVEFPTGRYELRGDGTTTPYRWVWIPSAPDAPPAEPLPDVVPRAAPAPAEPAQRSELYRWTDDDGAVHWTDRLEKVPEPYRAKVTKRLL